MLINIINNQKSKMREALKPALAATHLSGEVTLVLSRGIVNRRMREPLPRYRL